MIRRPSGRRFPTAPGFDDTLPHPTHPTPYIHPKRVRRDFAYALLLIKPGCSFDELFDCRPGNRQTIRTEVIAEAIEAFLDPGIEGHHFRFGSGTVLGQVRQPRLVLRVDRTKSARKPT